MRYNTNVMKMMSDHIIYRILLIVAGTLLICFFSSTPSYALDHRLKDAHFEANTLEGTLFARWNQVSNREEDVTKYKIKVYYYNTKIALDWTLVSKPYFDVTSIVDRLGKGRYYFVVYPAAETEKMKISSTYIDIDDTFLTNIRNRAQERRDSQDQNYLNGVDSEGNYLPCGWISQPEGNYQYRMEDHKLLHSCFKEIDGITYYFTTQGLTLTGWHVIDQNWYCFDSEGGLYKNTVTPDGYTVNELGQYVEDGEVVEANEPVSKSIDPKTIKLIEKLHINISERAANTGEIYKVTFTNPTEGKISDISYSKEPEDWVLGEEVIISLSIRAYAGCCFSNWTAITCNSKLKLLSSEITSREVNCQFSYIPGKQLPSITNLYSTSDFILRWDEVPDAYYYEVTLSDASTGKSLQRTKVYDPSFDYSAYSGTEFLKIQIVAKAYNAKLRNIKYSYTYTWDKVDFEQMQHKTINGSFYTEDNGQLYYIDEYGERIKNRKVELGGFYFIFDEKGYAVGPGWYTHSDGTKYYFDEGHRMAVGDVTIDGKQYHFNAGELFEVPIGAYVKTAASTGTTGSKTTSTKTSTK